MCDPVSLSLAATAIGAVGSVGSTMSQMSAQKKQAQEVEIWQQKQKKFREAERLRQEGHREEAEAARQEGVEAISAEDQKRRQSEEEARLGNYLTGQDQTAAQETGGAPVSVADKALTAVSPTADPTFKNDLAKKINEATTGARERMKALATVQSYGNSFGGLATENPLSQARAGAGIDQFNEFRRGSLGAFGTEKAIEPVQVTYQPSPLAGLFSTALSLGSQGLGKAASAGNLFGGTASTAVTDPWQGIRFPTTTTTIPTSRPIF